MDLVKWLQKKKRQNSGSNVDTTDDVESEVSDAQASSRGRKFRSRSVDPTSVHYLAAQTVNLAHHGKKTSVGNPHLMPTPQPGYGSRRLSLSTASNDTNASPLISVEDEATSGKKRRKSRGMMAIFGSGNVNGCDADVSTGSKSIFFPMSRKSSPVDLDGSAKKEKSKKTKKKKLSRSRDATIDVTPSDKVVDMLTVTRPSDARRHSVSVVVTAPPNQPPVTAKRDKSVSPTKASKERQRRRSQGLPASFDYTDAMFNALKYRNHLNVDDDDDDDCDGGSVSGPYIRPPIVVVTSQRRKYSLQCDNDVRGLAEFYSYRLSSRFFRLSIDLILRRSLK